LILPFTQKTTQYKFLCNQAIGDDPEIAELIPNSREIINLRNVIVHGYAVVENETIWGILQSDLPDLYDQVRKIL